MSSTHAQTQLFVIYMFMSFGFAFTSFDFVGFLLNDEKQIQLFVWCHLNKATKARGKNQNSVKEKACELRSIE